MDTPVYWIAAAITVLIAPLLTAVVAGRSGLHSIMGNLTAAETSKEDNSGSIVEQDSTPGSAKKAKWKKKKALKKITSSVSVDDASVGGAVTRPGDETHAPATPRASEGMSGFIQTPPDSADKAEDGVWAAEVAAERPVITRSNSGHSVPELDMR